MSDKIKILENRFREEINSIIGNILNYKNEKFFDCEFGKIEFSVISKDIDNKYDNERYTVYKLILEDLSVTNGNGKNLPRLSKEIYNRLNDEYITNIYE